MLRMHSIPAKCFAYNFGKMFSLESHRQSIRRNKSQNRQNTLHKLRAKQGAKPLNSHQHQQTKIDENHTNPAQQAHKPTYEQREKGTLRSSNPLTPTHQTRQENSQEKASYLVLFALSLLPSISKWQKRNILLVPKGLPTPFKERGPECILESSYYSRNAG